MIFDFIESAPLPRAVPTSAPVDVPSAPVSPSPRFCSFCGSALTPNAKFCSKCGGKVR